MSSPRRRGSADLVPFVLPAPRGGQPAASTVLAEVLEPSPHPRGQPSGLRCSVRHGQSSPHPWGSAGDRRGHVRRAQFSPRLRGSAGPDDAESGNHKVLPAPAGVSRCPLRCRPPPRSTPRAGGGQPFSASCSPALRPSSPCRRGSAGPPAAAAPPDRVLPARAGVSRRGGAARGVGDVLSAPAGVSRTPTRRAARGRCPPRAGGGQPSEGSLPGKPELSSLRRRGSAACIRASEPLVWSSLRRRGSAGERGGAGDPDPGPPRTRGVRRPSGSGEVRTHRPPRTRGGQPGPGRHSDGHSRLPLTRPSPPCSSSRRSPFRQGARSHSRARPAH